MDTPPIPPVASVPAALTEAICDLLWRVTPHGTDGDGNITRYVVTAGTVHRLIGQAQAAGIPAALRVPALADEDYRDRQLAERAPWLDRYDRSIPDPPLCPMCARVGYPITGCPVCHKPWYCDRGQHMDDGDGVCGDCGAVRPHPPLPAPTAHKSMTQTPTEGTL